MLAHGADEHAARNVVERLHLCAETVTMPRASGRDLLVGPQLDPLPSLLGS
jgi:hypothetical protein